MNRRAIEQTYKYYSHGERIRPISDFDIPASRIGAAFLNIRISNTQVAPRSMTGTTVPAVPSGIDALLSKDTSVKVHDTLADMNVSDLFEQETKPQLLPIVLILGPPGSGKGTLCKHLAADFNLHHISVGNWLRHQALYLRGRILRGLGMCCACLDRG